MNRLEGYCKWSLVKNLRPQEKVNIDKALETAKKDYCGPPVSDTSVEIQTNWLQGNYKLWGSKKSNIDSKRTRISEKKLNFKHAHWQNIEITNNEKKKRKSNILSI